MCEAQALASTGGSGDPVIPLLLQNQPPMVEGKEKDELADVQLRPEQVRYSTFVTALVHNYQLQLPL